MSDCTCPRIDGYRIKKKTCPAHNATDTYPEESKDLAWYIARVRELEAERPELWDEGLRAGMDSVLTAHERLADSRADWLPPVPTNPYREFSDGSE